MTLFVLVFQIQKLDLWNSNLSDDDIKTLTPILDQVKRLSLGDNKITASGGRYLADALRHNEQVNLVLSVQGGSLQKQAVLLAIPELHCSQTMSSFALRVIENDLSDIHANQLHLAFLLNILAIEIKLDFPN